MTGKHFILKKIRLENFRQVKVSLRSVVLQQFNISLLPNLRLSVENSLLDLMLS